MGSYSIKAGLGRRLEPDTKEDAGPERRLGLATEEDAGHALASVPVSALTGSMGIPKLKRGKSKLPKVKPLVC